MTTSSSSSSSCPSGGDEKDGASTLSSVLADPARPVFLLGEVPPGEGTPPGRCLEIATKFAARSRALATDGFVVYDIQDEPGRSDVDRPFPFRRVGDSSEYAALLAQTSNKPCCVYKCVADAAFEDWVDRAATEHGHSAINLVGRATSGGEYVGPTIAAAMEHCRERGRGRRGPRFGCVCIAERHTPEAAAARGKPHPTEHLNMMRKQRAGAEWFISQAVYDPEPTIRLLKDYGALCRTAGVVPNKVVLTFAPVSRKRTMNFVKWLGVRVPPETEKAILESERPVDESVETLCGVLRTVLEACAGVGVPLGISCESVSVYKSEIDAVHELFRRLQGILLNHRGTPWKVVWIEAMPELGRRRRDEEKKEKVDETTIVAAPPVHPSPYPVAVGAVLGAALVAFGYALGEGKKHSR